MGIHVRSFTRIAMINHKLKHGGTKFAENSWAFVLEKPRRSCEDTPFYGLSYAGKGVFATVTQHLFCKGL